MAWTATDAQQEGARAGGEESSCLFGNYGNVLSSLPFAAETEADPVRESAPRSGIQRPAPKHVLAAIWCEGTMEVVRAKKHMRMQTKSGGTRSGAARPDALRRAGVLVWVKGGSHHEQRAASMCTTRRCLLGRPQVPSRTPLHSVIFYSCSLRSPFTLVLLVACYCCCPPLSLHPTCTSESAPSPQESPRNHSSSTAITSR